MRDHRFRRKLRKLYRKAMPLARDAGVSVQKFMWSLQSAAKYMVMNGMDFPGKGWDLPQPAA